MKKAIVAALALSAAATAAIPAFAADRVVIRDDGWAPRVVVRHGHRGYWDERHGWHRMVIVRRHGHRGYWDHHHRWHDWNG